MWKRTSESKGDHEAVMTIVWACGQLSLWDEIVVFLVQIIIIDSLGSLKHASFSYLGRLKYLLFLFGEKFMETPNWFSMKICMCEYVVLMMEPRASCVC